MTTTTYTPPAIGERVRVRAWLGFATGRHGIVRRLGRVRGLPICQVELDYPDPEEGTPTSLLWFREAELERSL